MQAEDKGIDKDSSRTQINKHSSHEKKHNSGKEMSEKPHELHEENRHKPAPAEKMLHEGHPEDQTMRTEEKSMEDEDEQPEGMKHEGHEPSGGGKGHGDHHTHMLEDFKRRFIVSLVLTFPVLVLSPMIQEFFGFEVIVPGANIIIFLLSSVVYFYGGYPFLKGIKQELTEKSPGMMTLIAVAISVAYFYSSAVIFGLPGEVFFWELVTLIDIMLLGHWLEMRSVMGASKALEELIKIMPSIAHLRKNGETVDVSVDQLKIGNRVLVKPGEKVPVDGTVIEGTSSVNESMLTGESKPVTKNPGNDVIGGSINGEAAFVVEVKKTGKDTYLNQVVELVRTAQESKSKTQDLANRAALILTIIALTVGTLTFILWNLFGQELVFALERAVTVMVISCPHALGLAIPLVVAVSTSMAAKSGLLIRDRQAFEKARSLEAVIFDKTGTLTEGRFGVTDIVSLSGEEGKITDKTNRNTNNETSDKMNNRINDRTNDRANAKINDRIILSLAASLEASSEHPIARGVLESAKERGLEPLPVEKFSSIPGKGIEGIIDGKKYLVVSPGYLEETGIDLKDQRIEEIKGQGKTVVFLLEKDKVLGALALADIVRKESMEAISKLKGMGIKCLMLTGDNRYVAAWVARELELDDYFAEVLPHEKAAKVLEVQEQYVTGMVGDGVNDAPALAQADVGIAIGAGTDVAIETADIVMVKNDPRDVLYIIELSRKTYSKMYQNLLWATGYNALAIPLAAGILYGYGILLSPAIGAVLMSLSTIIVAINARTLNMG